MLVCRDNLLGLLSLRKTISKSNGLFSYEKTIDCIGNMVKMSDVPFDRIVTFVTSRNTSYIQQYPLKYFNLLMSHAAFTCHTNAYCYSYAYNKQVCMSKQ